jgi:hypothetical protein
VNTKIQVPPDPTPTSRELVEITAYAKGQGPSARWAWLTVACFIAFVTYCLWWRQAPFNVTDTTSYLEVLRDFLDHGHFSQFHDRTPGLPIFLLLTGTGRTYFYAALFIHLISVGALALLLVRLDIRPQFVWSFVFVSLLPPYVQNTAYLASEGVTSAFLALGFVGISLYVLDHRWAYCLLGSLFFLWAGITRPTNLPLPFLLSGILLAMRGRKMGRGAAVLVGLPALLLGSYLIYSGHRLQSFNILSMAGYQLSNSTVEFYDDIGNSIVREELVKAREEMSAENLPPNFAVWRARRTLKQRLGLSDDQLGRFLLGVNLTLIKRHPEAYMERILQRLNMYWFPYATRTITAVPILKAVWYVVEMLVGVLFLFELTVLAGLYVGSWILNRAFEFVGNRAVVYVLAIGIIYETMSVSYLVIGYGNPRYRSVTDVLIIFAVILIFDWTMTMWQASRYRFAANCSSTYGKRL